MPRYPRHLITYIDGLPWPNVAAITAHVRALPGAPADFTLTEEDDPDPIRARFTDDGAAGDECVNVGWLLDALHATTWSAFVRIAGL